ncbi:MAG TPA: TetR/AcrR family transcriptional regulator [Chthoniobacterales bacterium]|nr:TetR/AcrR family transcriptional regulator [Chthoniobacterales bacterium]
MSGNRTEVRPVFDNGADSPKKEDRRVRRTRDRLGDALVELLVEKPFDDITVQEVLDRAKVSRSTFYSHYRDKNDLFLSDSDEFWEKFANALVQRGDKSERIAPVQELFGHVADVRPFYNALVESGKIQDVWELGREHFARGIEKRLGQVSRAGRVPADQRAAIAHGLAGTLFSLLDWWIRNGTGRSAKEMDELFHQMVWAGCTSAFR